MEKENIQKGPALILDKMEDYLRTYPAASGIEYFQDMFKLTYTYSTPYTDSKNSKNVFLPNKDISAGQKVENTNSHLSYNS